MSKKTENNNSVTQELYYTYGGFSPRSDGKKK